MDTISELPDNIVETIILCLPLCDAVRTSILSKKWRYKWAALSTLSLGPVFYDTMYIHRKAPEITYPCLVKTILLQHIGHIKKFVIYIPDLTPSGIGEINLTIRVALKNGIEELIVEKAGSSAPHALPSFLFSCGEQLTKLELTECVFNPPLGLRGFSNLKTLHLSWLMYSNFEILSNFISSCPKLRVVALNGLDNLNEHLCIRAPSLEVFTMDGGFGSILFQEPYNLVYLKIYLAKIKQRMNIPCDDYMLNFFSNLGKIKYLSLGGYMCRLLGGDCVPNKLSTELDNLKTIEVDSLDLGHKREFHCLLRLIRSSPNLQLLDIDVDDDISGEVDNLCDAGEYVDWCFQHLQTVRIQDLKGTKPELKMIEILLSCSPVLQVLSIDVESQLDKDAKLEISKELMRFCRSSTTAEILCKYD